MRILIFGCGLALLAGCAATGPASVQAPPLAEDLGGWSAPVASAEPAPEPLTSAEPETARSNREVVFTYEAGQAYAIKVPMGAPLDIVLQPGEKVHNLVGGDRTPAQPGEDQSPPWEVKEGVSGAGMQSRPHIFVTVTKPGLKTGLTITTTKRTYYLDCQSVANSHSPALGHRPNSSRVRRSVQSSSRR